MTRTPGMVLRIANLRLHVFETWLALSAVVGAAVFFANGGLLSASSIGLKVGFELSYLWNGCYLAGGVAVLYGLMRPAPRFELLGLGALAAAIFTNGVSVVAVRGSAGVNTAVTLLMLGVACSVRTVLVYRSTRALAELLDVEVPDR